MLEQLASCALIHSSKPVLLLLAALALLGGFIVSNNSASGGGLVVGVIVAALLSLWYVASRREVIMFVASGTRIHVSTWRMKAHGARQLVDTIEAAKDARYMLGKSSAAYLP